MDLKKILYVEANTREIAAMSNAVMKKSKKFATAIYNMNLVNSRKTRLGKEVVKDIFETSHCYDENGYVTKEGKKILEKSLEEIGLSKNATLLNVMWEMVKKYK